MINLLDSHYYGLVSQYNRWVREKIPYRYIIAFMYCFLFVAAFSISYMFLLHQLHALPFFGANKGDAGGYILISHNIGLGLMSGVRTYAYPLFLHLIQYPYSSSLNSLQLFSLYILLIQFTLYAASVLFFANSVTQSSPIRLLITAALLLQINVLSFLSVTLTEPLSLSMLLITLGIFFGLRKGSTRAFLLGISSAFCMEVRPANLWVYGLILTLFLLEGYKDYKENKKEFLKLLCLFSMGSFISFSPQLYYNWIYFHVITPLPASHLGQLQADLGRSNAFVAFSLNPQSGANVLTKNPFLFSSAHPFTWVSINGLSYAVFKIMIMLHYPDLFVYQSLKESCQQMVIFFSSFNTYFGLFGLFFQIKNIPTDKRIALLLGLLFCISLHLTTMLENRFTFSICLLLIPFSFYQCASFIREKKIGYLYSFIPFFLFTNLFNSFLLALTPGAIP